MDLHLVRPEGLMGHDWIFDVLSDLHDYACRNELMELAQRVEETLITARREVGGEMAQDGRVPVLVHRRAH